MLFFDLLATLALRSSPAQTVKQPPKTPIQARTQTEVYSYLRLATNERLATRLTPLVLNKSRKYKLPALLVARLIIKESNGNPNARNGACVGLMQVHRQLWFTPHENPYAVADNLEAGCRLLARLKRRYPTWEQTLTAYNFGENHHVTRRLKTSTYARAILSSSQ